MKTYLCYYIDRAGKRHFEWQKALDERACCEKYAARDIVPAGVWQVPTLGRGGSTRLSSRALSMLFSQLSVALESGVPLFDALHYMEEEQAGEHMRAFIKRLKEGVMAGNPLSSCIRREKAFSPHISAWLAIGEKQGRLSQVMADIASHLSEEEKMRKQLAQQLLYPMAVLIGVLIVGFFLALVAMPLMARQFIGLTGNGSGILRGFLVAQEFLFSYGWAIALFLVVAFLSVYLARVRTEGSDAWQRPLRECALRIPVLKKVIVLKIYVPFARFLGQMLRSGVPAGEAMVAIEGYFARSLFSGDVRKVKDILSKGGRLSLAIAESAFVPPLARQMLLNGERYGRMSEALLQSADYYESTLLEELGLLIRFVEPIAVALLGVLVLMMALGLFLPLMDAYSLVVAS